MGENQCRFLFFVYMLPLEIQLSRGQGWDPINWFNPTTFLCLSQARAWISNAISQSFLTILCAVSSVKRGDSSFC